MKMKTIKVKKKVDDYATAQQQAIESIPVRSSELSMVGWYDRDRRTGGPLEVCGDQKIKVARDYARSHGAEYQVDIGPYELFYLPVPEGTAELDSQTLLEIHRELELDRFENVQGG